MYVCACGCNIRNNPRAFIRSAHITRVGIHRGRGVETCASIYFKYKFARALQAAGGRVVVLHRLNDPCRGMGRKEGRKSYYNNILSEYRYQVHIYTLYTLYSKAPCVCV